MQKVVCVTEQQGIVEKTPDLCIRNLGQLSKKGMQNTDLQIIEIIRNKEQRPRYALQA